MDGDLYARTEDGLTTIYETAVFPNQTRFQVIRFNDMLYKIQKKPSEEAVKPASSAPKLPPVVKSALDELRSIATALEVHAMRIDRETLRLDQEIEYNKRLFEPQARQLSNLHH